MYKIEIKNLEFYAILGMLEKERHMLQKVNVYVALWYEYKENIIDYAKIASLVKKTVKKERFFLIEEALEHLASKIHSLYPEIEKLKITISKPQILEDAVPSVTLKKSFKHKKV